MDYQDTFLPVAKLSSVLVFIFLVVTHHWIVYQLDVKNTFLNNVLDEKV